MSYYDRHRFATDRLILLRGAAVAICLLMVLHPLAVLAARSSSGGGRVTPTGSTNFPAPVVGSPVLGRFSNTEVDELNSHLQLDRAATASTQNYEIVPPFPPDLASTGPLPGYRIVRLGRNYNNRLCLTGTVGGIKGLMILDTGANNTALSNTTFRALLLNASATLPAGVPRALTLNGTTTPLAEAPDFHVGKSNLGAVPVSLIPHQYLVDPGPPGRRERVYDGLLGENILRHYNAMVDCGRLALYLNLDPSKRLNLSSSFVHHGWTRVPMSDLGNDFTVPCTLNGHPFRLIVDTGAPFTDLDRNLLATAQVGSHDLPARSGLIGLQAERAGVVDLDHLQIGNYTAVGVQMITTAQSLAAFGGRHDDSTGGPIVGLLGGDILGSNNAVVDIGGKALYLKHAEGKPPKLPMTSASPSTSA